MQYVNKLVLSIILVIMALSCKAQKMELLLTNKTLVANVATIYEEVVGNSDCAGGQLYLVLEFNKEHVAVLEKSISTCGEESITSLGNFRWKLLKTNNVIIEAAPEKMKYSYLNNLELKLSDGILLGKRKNDANELTNNYVFKEVFNKK